MLTLRIRKHCIIVVAALSLIFGGSVSVSYAVPIEMVIKQGTYTPASGDAYSIDGIIQAWDTEYDNIQLFYVLPLEIDICGIDPITWYWTDGLSENYLEIYSVSEDHALFGTYNYPDWIPDAFGRWINIKGTLFYKADSYYADSQTAVGLTLQSIQIHIDLWDSDPHPTTPHDTIDMLAVARPVPEPATVLLLGSGLVGLVGFRKKLKK